MDSMITGLDKYLDRKTPTYHDDILVTEKGYITRKDSLFTVLDKEFKVKQKYRLFYYKGHIMFENKERTSAYYVG